MLQQSHSLVPAPKSNPTIRAPPPIFRLPSFSQGQINSCTGDFAPPEAEFRAEFCETNFGPGISRSCFFQQKRPPKNSPSRNSPPKIHLPKFNPEIGPKKFTLHLCRAVLADLFKIITRMKLLFSNYLGDYSYSFQGSSEIISITVTVSLFFLQNGVTGKKSPREFPSIFGNYSYMI